jgi:hypothetical protein
MSNEGDRSDLASLWRSSARRASDAQLTLLAALVFPSIAGFVLVGINVLAARKWWPALLLPLVLSAFGFWGIADREIREGDTSEPSTAWIAVRAAAGILAGVCGVEIAVLFLRVSIGTWIS